MGVQKEWLNGQETINLGGGNSNTLPETNIAPENGWLEY